MANPNPHLYRTVNRNHIDAGTLRGSKVSQAWHIGQTVKVGFVSGLVVVTLVDGIYTLERVDAKGQTIRYTFEPYAGLSRND